MVTHVQYNMVRTGYFLMRWWLCLLCTTPCV